MFEVSLTDEGCVLYWRLRSKQITFTFLLLISEHVVLYNTHEAGRTGSTHFFHHDPVMMILSTWNICLVSFVLILHVFSLHNMTVLANKNISYVKKAVITEQSYHAFHGSSHNTVLVLSYHLSEQMKLHNHLRSLESSWHYGNIVYCQSFQLPVYYVIQSVT